MKAQVVQTRTTETRKPTKPGTYRRVVTITYELIVAAKGA